jgi:hypothetical protein
MLEAEQQLQCGTHQVLQLVVLCLLVLAVLVVKEMVLME